MYNHIIDRNLVEWGTYGKYGNKPLRKILIKNLSDSHLLHIIEHIKINVSTFGHDSDILRLMMSEAKYRTENYIFVPEYD